VDKDTFIYLAALAVPGGLFGGLNARLVRGTQGSWVQIKEPLGRCLFACRETWTFPRGDAGTELWKN